MVDGHASSVAGKRRRPRDSPLLQPLTTKPKSPPRNGVFPKSKRLRLPKETRRKWMLEALEGLDTADMMALLKQHSPQRIHSLGTSWVENSVAVSTHAELAQDHLEKVCSDDRDAGPSSSPSSKKSPTCAPGTTLLPLCSRRQGTLSPKKPPHKSPTKLSPVAALASKEMLSTLQAHLEQKIKGDIWANEVRSRLARPLSATVFCSRDEQLQHPLAAPQYRTIAATAYEKPLYPYSTEAHELRNRIGRMYRHHVFRREILAGVRRLAIAIRYFRRVVKPWLVRQHRRRRRAAVRIQRCLRRHFRWKRCVLRPFVTRFVLGITARSTARVRARHVLVRRLKRLVIERKQREAHARERRRVLRRWVAKTRVALFVHIIWCAHWFHYQRVANIVGMRDELHLLEASDVAVEKEYTSIFLTSLGRTLLKRELVQWRASVKLRASSTPQITEKDTEDGETARLRQCFRIFDMDGSGTLDLDEFELMLSYLRSSLSSNTTDKKRVKLTTAQVRDLFASLDIDGNGTVTYQEFETWWSSQHTQGSSSSASVSLLSAGLTGLVVTSHGLLFWLLGKKQQLEKKFVKKLMIKKAMDNAKRALFETILQDSLTTPRCGNCGRRFGLRRDLQEHTVHYCEAPQHQWMLDTFILQRWIREEELRLLEKQPQPEEQEQPLSENEE